MNPQKENGYTAIANELLDALISFRVPGELRQVFDAIVRKTYGFNKKEDYISNSQIMEMTGCGKQNVYRSLKRLVEHKLVIKTDYSPKKGFRYKINKNYKEWIPFTVVKTDDKKKRSQNRLRRSSKLITTVVKTDYETSSELTDTKDNIHSKDTLKTSEPVVNPPESEKPVKAPKELLEGKQWNELIDPFEKVNPLFLRFYSNKTQRHALQEVVDAIGFVKAKWTVENLYAATKKPYAPKITTPCQLRDKLGELQVFWRQEKEKGAERQKQAEERTTRDHKRLLL